VHAFLNKVTCHRVIEKLHISGLMSVKSAVSGVRNRSWFWFVAQFRIFPNLTTMRALTLLPLLFIHSAFAAPASDAQIVLGETTAVVDVYPEGKGVETVIHQGGNVSSEDEVETWVEEDREYVKQNGLVCMSFQ
jgi:hypothetical protein